MIRKLTLALALLWACSLPCVVTAEIFDIEALEAIAGDGWFRPYEGNPLLVRGAPGTWDDWALGSASVVKAGDTYHMYYEGWGEDSIQIGHATSPDGINWIKDGANPVLALSPSGWDSGGTWDPFVIYEEGQFKMWYGGTPNNAGDFQWGYATSTDGSSFVKVGKISNIPNGEVEDDHVVHDQFSGDYHMYYWDRNEEPLGLFRATSPNETNFNFAAAQPVTINGVNYPTMYKFSHVFQEDNSWHMFYGEFVRPRCHDCEIGYATSNDGINWTTQNTNVLVGQDGEVIKVADELYLMYYGPDGYFDGENGDIRVAVMKGSLSDLAETTGPLQWDAGAGDSLWSSGGNWQLNNMNGPGGVVPRSNNVFFNYGTVHVNSAVPPVNDMFIANNVPPPSGPNSPSNHTQIFVDQGGLITLSNGQVKLGAFTGPSSPSSGVAASITISGNGKIDSRYGVVTNPFYHPTNGNISSTINISGDGVFDAGTGLFLGGGNTTINMSDNAVFLVPDGIFENNGGVFNPNNVSNPHGINAVINLEDSARFIVSTTGPFAVSAALANLYISSGLFQGNDTLHFVDGDHRIFMAAPLLPGDYNGNGTVDAADYTVWRDAMSASATTLLNDPTPGTVSESDFTYWRAHFGESLEAEGAGSAAIPEPSSLLLAFLATLLTAICRKR